MNTLALGLMLLVTCDQAVEAADRAEISRPYHCGRHLCTWREWPLRSYHVLCLEWDDPANKRSGLWLHNGRLWRYDYTPDLRACGGEPDCPGYSGGAVRGDGRRELKWEP